MKNFDNVTSDYIKGSLNTLIMISDYISEHDCDSDSIIKNLIQHNDNLISDYLIELNNRGES